MDTRTATARTALVTGGGRGIGRAAALALARVGHRVAIGARSTSELEGVAAEIRALGGPALTLTGDLERDDTPAAWLAQVARQLGPVEILVNNAGHAPSAKIEATTDADLRRLLALHVEAPFRLCRGVVPAMKQVGFGRIVNVASVSGLGGAPYISAYTTAKHGLVGLTRALAAELAKSGITVNAVCPGYVDTAMTVLSARNVAQKTGRSEDEARKTLAAMNRGGRLITPEEVAAAVLFLAADHSAGISGTCIVVDGGTLVA